MRKFLGVSNGPEKISSGAAPLASNPVNISVDEQLPSPTAHNSSDLEDIMTEVNGYLQDAGIRLSLPVKTGLLDVELMLKAEGIDIVAHENGNSDHPLPIDPIPLATFNSESSKESFDAIMQGMKDFKERGFTFKEESVAAIAIGILIETWNIEASPKAGPTPGPAPSPFG